MSSRQVGATDSTKAPGSVATLILQGYLAERPDGWLEPTTDQFAATHAHALDPETGDLVVVTIAEAESLERPREVVLGDTLMIYGV